MRGREKIQKRILLRTRRLEQEALTRRIGRGRRAFGMERKRERERVIFFLSFSPSFSGSAREETGFRSLRFCAVYLAGCRGGEGRWSGRDSSFFQVARATREEVSGDGCYRGEDGLRKNTRRGQERKVERKESSWVGGGTHLSLARVPCAN